jgi:hypothetical protein
VSFLPIQALHDLSIREAALSLAGSVAFTAVATFIFYEGLRRYESGNLMTMKG